jgi:Icc protein
MTRIAHLSDTHLDGSPNHNQRLRRALEHASLAHPDYLLITGDLTSSGKMAEFQELSDCLVGWHESRVTLIAGNHDGEPQNWLRALRQTGLSRFAASSTPGSSIDLGDSVIAPVSSQASSRALLFRAQGAANTAQLAQARQLAQAYPARAVIIAMHHGPQWHPLQPFDGLSNRASVLQLLRENPNLWICCGHDHRALDLGQVFTAASAAEHPDPVRIYEVVGPRLVPTYRSALSGSCWGWLTG